MKISLLCLLYLFFLPLLNKTAYPLYNQLSSAIIIHYFGHSSFLFIFDYDKSLFTDYGVANSYGLNNSGPWIKIKAFPVTKRNPGDNHSYLISNKGISILFIGDCQGAYGKVRKQE